MFNKVIKFDKFLLILLTLGIIFFLIYSYLALSFPRSLSGEPKLIFNSPDETANYFYSDLFAQKSTLKFIDPVNQFTNGLISPRSLRVIDGQTVPASFIGLPIIYGSLAKIFGTCSLAFYTPLLAILGIIFFYLLIKEIFNKKTAILTALFVFILPAYWYYATKGLMPNITFLVFFIMALYCFIKVLKSRQLIFYLFFGLFLALSLMIRTSEIIWMISLFFILTVYFRKKINWLFLFLSILIFFLIFSPVFYFNQQIYGSPLSLGYSLEMAGVSENIISQGINLLGMILLPFGFHPRLALNNLFNYTLGIFPLWSALALVSLLFIIIRLIVNKRILKTEQKLKNELWYSLLFILMGGYLFIYYGSWPIHDYPDPEAVTIGTSYVRYWLPVYLFSLPLISIFLLKFLGRFKVGLPVVTGCLVAVLFISSFSLVMLDREEGIYQVKRNILSYQKIANAVFKQTQNNAVIIAERMDKVFFPNRRVVFKLNNVSDYLTIRRLIENNFPVYYFYFTRSTEELAEFNQKYFNSYGLEVGKSLLDFEKQSLYPVKIMQKEEL